MLVVNSRESWSYLSEYWILTYNNKLRMNSLQILETAADALDDMAAEYDVEESWLIYAIAAGLQAVVPTILYALIAPTNKVYATTTNFLTKIFAGVWWPTFIAWVGVQFFDSEQVREICKIAVTISLGGPFFMYWVVITDLLTTATDTANWGSWLWWVLFGVAVVYTIASIVFQVIFVPQVYQWVEEAAQVESALEEIDVEDEEDDEEDVEEDVEEEEELFSL